MNIHCVLLKTWSCLSYFKDNKARAKKKKSTVRKISLRKVSRVDPKQVNKYQRFFQLVAGALGKTKLRA